MPEQEVNKGTRHVKRSSRTGAGSASTNHPPPPAIPDYQLLRRVGQGSYGEVWLARNLTGTYRAAKIVHRSSFDNARPYDRELEGIKRFEPFSRRYQSQIDILHVGQNEREGYFYYVMELADDVESGERIEPDHYIPRTLQSELESRGRLPMAECLQLALSLTRALEQLHQEGLIHRDLKPSNIIFINGTPKLADVGLIAERDNAMSFVGTRGYLAPEGPGTVQADIYSLGKVLYEATTGKDRQEFPLLPTDLEAMPEEAELFEINEVLAKACHGDLRQRYGSIGEMRLELLALQAGQSVRRNRLLERRVAALRKLGVGVLLLTALSTSGYFYQRHQTEQVRNLARQEALQRQNAEEARSDLERQHVEALFESGKDDLALAYLADLLRQNPTNQTVAGRIISALTYREFALPLLKLPHDLPVSSFEFSPDGSQIVTRCEENLVRIWDSHSGLLSQELLHQGTIRSAKFSPNGESLATGSSDGAVRIWDPSTGQPACALLTQDRPVSDLRFSPDGGQLATSSTVGGVRLWNAQTGQLLAGPLKHQSPLRQLFFSPDSKRLLTFSDSGLFLWDSGNGELLRTHTVPTLRISNRLRIGDLSPDGRRVVFKGNFVELNLFDLETGHLTVGRRQHEWPVNRAAFSPDGRQVATASNDKTVRLWDVETGLSTGAPLEHLGAVMHVSWSPNGELLATASKDRAVRVWNVRSHRRRVSPIYHDTMPWRVQFSPDGERLATMVGQEVRLWDIRPGKARPMLLPHQPEEASEAGVVSVRFDSDGGRLITASSDELLFAGSFRGIDNFNAAPAYSAFARVWDFPSGQPLGNPLRHDNDLFYAEFSPDGTFAVTASKDNTARVWDAARGLQIGPALQHEDKVFLACFSPDGRRIATASVGGSGGIWDSTTGQRLHELKHRKLVRHVAFSPDGARVITSSFDSTARIWDVESGALLLTLSHPGEVLFAEFSPDGKRVVTSSYPAFARIWDPESGTPLTDWLGHGGMVVAAHFSGDSRRVVTASVDGTAKVWDAATGQLLIRPLTHGWTVTEARFHAEDQQIITASWDKLLRVWDARSGHLVSEPLPHADWVQSFDVNPDGRWLATACMDGAAHVWELPVMHESVPAWLPDLVEAVGGRRLDRFKNPEESPPDALGEIKERISRDKSVNLHTQWAAWFFSDRSTRPISPSASVTMKEYLQLRLAQDTASPGWSVEEALELAPMEPRVLARLGRKLVTRRYAHDFIAGTRADWLTLLATRLGPLVPMVWWARAEVLLEIGQVEAAREALQGAMKLHDSDPNAWYVKALLDHHAGQDRAAYEAFSRAIELAHAQVKTTPSPHASYLNEGLRPSTQWKQINPDALANRARLQAARPYATDRMKLEADWLSSMAVARANPERRMAFSNIRAEILKQTGQQRTPILSQPQSQNILIGGAVSFEVGTIDGEPLSYQWRHEGVGIPGATNRVLTLPSVDLGMVGHYSVQVRGLTPSSRYIAVSAEAGLGVAAGGLIHGALTKEVYREIPGQTLDSLFGNSKFPDRPDEVGSVYRFETPLPNGENFGVRLLGLIIPPETGDYVFYSCSDDEGQLFLSTDGSPTNLRLVAHDRLWNPARDWRSTSRRPNRGNISKPIALEAGRGYYMEAVMKQAEGPAYFGVAWQLPGAPPPTNGAPPIASSHLAHPDRSYSQARNLTIEGEQTTTPTFFAP